MKDFLLNVAVEVLQLPIPLSRVQTEEIHVLLLEQQEKVKELEET